MAAFDQVFATLRQLGFFDFLLPWLFTFAVVFGILNKAGLFGDKDNRRISAAIALVAAFFVTGFAGQQLANFFISIFGGAAMIFAGILVIMIFIGLVGHDPKSLAKTGSLVVLIIVGIVLWLLSVGVAKGVGFLPVLSPDLIAFVLVIVVIVLAVWVIVREGKPEAAGKKPGE